MGEPECRVDPATHRLDLDCRCGRGRAGLEVVARTAPAELVRHPCPMAAIAQGRYVEEFCNCCPACTAVCLPWKIALRSEGIERAHGDSITRLYRNLVLLPR